MTEDFTITLLNNLVTIRLTLFVVFLLVVGCIFVIKSFYGSGR